MQEIFIIGFVVVLAIFFVFLLLKDSETNKKFARYERALESLMQENFALKKQLDAFALDNFSNTDTDALEMKLNANIERSVNEKIAPIFSALKNIEGVLDEFASEQQSRLFSLEERTREINKITPSIHDETEQIVRMYNEGKSIEQIAKDMRIGVGRVELALKFPNSY